MIKKLIQIMLVLYFSITLILFFLGVYLNFGNPVLVIGQAFLVFGLLTIRFSTIGYLPTIIGLFIVLHCFNILQVNSIYFKYIIVIFFPCIPGFILFSEWNDKHRILRKGAIEAEATYIGNNSLGWPKFSYSINNIVYQAVSYKRGEYNYHKNEKIKIIVSVKNNQKSFIPLPQKQIKLIKYITLFLLIFSSFILLVMLTETLN